jgi:predicted secreted protein
MTKTTDKRSGKIVIVSHCILNVHCLEDDLAIYPGLETEVVEVLVKKGVGIYQIPCPEIELSGIYRKALPKESYEHPKVREAYRKLAEKITHRMKEYTKKGYRIAAVIGAEVSPTCGIGIVGRWKKDAQGKRVFPRDVEFVPGRGVFMEELQACLEKIDVRPTWIGIPGKSLRSIDPRSFNETLQKLEKILDQNNS